MSGPLAPTPRTKRRTAARAASALACGLLVALLGLGGPSGVIGHAAAQPSKSANSGKDADKVDRNSPLPADAPGLKTNEKVAIPNTDRLMFNKIEDFKPVASEADNPDEYRAWCEFVTHAKQFTAAELDHHGAGDLTPSDLLKPQRSLFRCGLLRFDGKLVCVRRLPAPLYFKNNPDLGVEELYEARFVPLDESPLTPVSIVFTELPEALAGVRQKPPMAWLDVPAETWVTASGYFFKTMSVPGEQATATVGVPVLVGKSVTLIPGPPVPPGPDPTVLDRSLRIFRYIKDDAPMIPNPPTPDSWAEVASYHRVIRHAARFPAEELESHAVPGVKFADLFEDVRKDYKLKMVRFEGRLIRLKRMESNDLRAAGVNQLFEGWLVPATEPSGHPVVIVFTEPLEGVEPADRTSKWVSFAGYSFKLMWYQSAEKDAKGNHVWKKAPMLIGKSPIPRPDPDRPTPVTWGAFVWWVIAGGALVLVGGGALTWYNWRGDHKSKVAMDAVRGRNPFEAANAPPPA